MKKSIKKQVEESVADFLKSWDKEYIHFTEIEYEYNDKFYICERLGIPYWSNMWYSDRVVWEYMRYNYNYSNGKKYGLHGNSWVFELNS